MRNVVLVSIDSLRADHCGFMGYDRDTTPTLDELAAEGLSFENAIAPGPSTYESMPGIVTGQHMCNYPVVDDDADVYDDRGSLIDVNTRWETIPEWFDEQGYETAGFTTNPYTSATSNFARGFDYYEDFIDGGEGPLMRKAADIPVLSELKHVVTLVRGDRASKPWQDYYEEILEWVEGTDEPYFLWIFLLDPHTPYLAPGEYRDSSSVEMYYRNWKLWAAKKWGVDLPLDRDALVSLYNATIRSSDAFLDRLRSDLPGDPVVAVHADHGEGFCEHGTFGHHKQLYEENVHVPFVVWNAETTGTVDQPVSLTALPSVLRDAADGEISEPSGGPVISRTLGPEQVAIRDRNWKYIATIDTDSASITDEELYDLDDDPEEQQNCVEEHGELAAAYRCVIDRRLSHERELSTIYEEVPAVI